uniref:Uncharacterized protein n=1 Tax=Magnetococcus massalia (strain MO-1) TaxID=451514 RepID=A0A1S7LES9_MAGMO|nr:Exported protein of unknown function[Include ankyrin repeats] [Candidatus Magnetococcus massalia]
MRQLFMVLFVAIYLTPTLQAGEATSPLIQAIQSRDHATVKQLLNRGADPNAYNAQGWAAIHYAVEQEDPVVIKLLAQHGADLNRRQREGLETPLIQAVTSSTDQGLLLALLKEGADPNRYGQSAYTALYYAARWNTPSIDQLIQFGAALERPNMDGWTPLHVAIDAMNRQAAIKLLAHGANPVRGLPNGGISLVELAKKSQDASLTCLMAQSQTVWKHSKASRSKRVTEIWQECQRASSKAVLTTDFKLPALSKPCRAHFAPIIEDRLDTLSEKLETTPNYGHRLCDGYWPLLVALQNRNYSAAERLLHHNAMVIGPEDGPITPQLAILLATFKLPATLLQPLLQACDCSLGGLRFNGSNLMTLAYNTNDLAKIRLVHRLGFSLDAKDQEGDPAFMVIAPRANSLLIQWLDGQGVDLNQPAENGERLLHRLAQYGQVEKLETLGPLLLSLNSVDHRGWSPLHHAVFSGRYATFKKLLQFGANSKKRDKAGRTAIDLANAYGYGEFAKELTNQQVIPIKKRDHR